MFLTQIALGVVHCSAASLKRLKKRKLRKKKRRHFKLGIMEEVLEEDVLAEEMEMMLEDESLINNPAHNHHRHSVPPLLRGAPAAPPHQPYNSPNSNGSNNSSYSEGLSLLLEQLIDDECRLLLEAWGELVEEAEEARREEQVERVVWRMKNE